MRWEDERYVRLYTRDTGDWLFLSFDAQALFMMLLRKVDRAGILHLGKHGKNAVAVTIGHAQSQERIDTALDLLIADRCVLIDGEKLVVPNFIEAQEARISDAQRKRDQRERDRDKLVADGIRGNAWGLDETAKLDRDERKSQPVTPEVTAGHTPSHEVTPSLAKTRQDDPEEIAQGPAPQAPALAVAAPAKLVGVTVPTRNAYEDAYEKRYGARPPRNETINGKLAQFIRRVGAENAPAIARFYLTHNAARYARDMHPVGLMLMDAEKLCTEWQTGQKMTATRAQQEERTEENVGGWMDLAGKGPTRGVV